MLLDHNHVNGMNKSLDEYYVIAALLHDVYKTFGAVFNERALRLTLQKVKARSSSEGRSFFTKTLPALGKATEKALSGHTPLNATSLRYKSLPGTQLPRFLGELFQRVFDSSGKLLPEPCTKSVRFILQLTYCYYKYELPYEVEQEQRVVQKFERTEVDLTAITLDLETLKVQVDCLPPTTRVRNVSGRVAVVREARKLLSNLFAFFDPKDVYPRHGPGAVATRQQLWDKYRWTNVSSAITAKYPLDAFFMASGGAVCDSYREYSAIGEESLSARVILVPKDSRGPRLISCEPVDYQWVQQGLGKAIVSLVESHPLTCGNVHFTDQRPNQLGALTGSKTGEYATLDLNEASDRVSVALVRLLFPPHICEYLEACRSSTTTLPDGRVLRLLKFAPMGSALCFPILALTVWSILTAGLGCDADTRDGILVYGDDVIVPTAKAVDAMELLESFGLKINRDKSCISGLYRESCGENAFNGECVTPVRLRTVWSSEPLPETYTSWIAYANSFYDRSYFETYELIVSRLFAVYGDIPCTDMALPCPALRSIPEERRAFRSRTHKRFQRREWFVRTVTSPVIHHEMDGWAMLARYFAERANGLNQNVTEEGDTFYLHEGKPFRVRSYTRRGVSVLTKRWLAVDPRLLNKDWSPDQIQEAAGPIVNMDSSNTVTLVDVPAEYELSRTYAQRTQGHVCSCEQRGLKCLQCSTSARRRGF